MLGYGDATVVQENNSEYETMRSLVKLDSDFNVEWVAKCEEEYEYEGEFYDLAQTDDGYIVVDDGIYSSSIQKFDNQGQYIEDVIVPGYNDLGWKSYRTAKIISTSDGKNVSIGNKNNSFYNITGSDTPLLGVSSTVKIG